MWCANCRSDVAAEVSPGNRRVHCASCGGEIATPLTNRVLSRTQQARELLQRWSADRSHNPDAAATSVANAEEELTADNSVPQDSGESSTTIPFPRTAPAVDPAPERPADNPFHFRERPSAAEESASRQHHDASHESAGRSFRVDQGREGTDWLPRPETSPTGSTPKGSTDSADFAPGDSPGAQYAAAGDAESLPRASLEPRLRSDAGHSLAGPHVTVTPNPEEQQPPTKWVPLIGQSLAYAGVLGLMVGTCLVILGYFRGPATYAPTGWLITMAGQMLLFLGVVTLVSSGMEETTSTVAERIDVLGDRLLRIEQATKHLRGPHALPPAADKDSKPVANDSTSQAS